MNLVPPMTSDTTPAPYVITASSEFSGLPAWGAFDQTGTNRWATNSTSTGFIAAYLGSPKIATVYGIQGFVADFPGRSPKTWTMDGSNDGSSWTTLDTQTNAPSWSVGEMRSYTLLNTTAYSYYRINVTANQGDTFLVLGVVAFYGKDSTAGSVVNEKFDGVTVPALPTTMTALGGGSPALSTSTTQYLSSLNSLTSSATGQLLVSNASDSSNGNCSVSASFYCTGTTGTPSLFLGVGFQGIPGTSGFNCYLVYTVASSNQFTLYRYNGASLTSVYSTGSTVALVANKWYTFTLTRNGANFWLSCYNVTDSLWIGPTGTSSGYVLVWGPVTDGTPLASLPSYGGVYLNQSGSAIAYVDNFSVAQQVNPSAHGPLRAIQIGGEYLVAAAQYIGNTWLQIINTGFATSSIKTQLDLAISAGCNCVRLGSGTEGVAAALYTMNQYISALKTVLAYCRLHGLWVSYVEDESVPTGTSGQTAIWAAAISYRVSIAPILAQYANVFGFDVANEYDHVGGFTPVGGSQYVMNAALWDAFFQQALPAIRAVAPSVPLTGSTFNSTGLGGSTYQFDYIETHQYNSAPGAGSYSGIYSGNAGAIGKYFFIGEHGQYIGSSSPTRLQLLQGVWTNVVQATYTGGPGCIGASWYVCLYDSLNSGCGNQSCGYEMWSEAGGGGPPFVLESDIGPTWEGYTVTSGSFPIPPVSNFRRRRR